MTQFTRQYKWTMDILKTQLSNLVWSHSWTALSRRLDFVLLKPEIRKENAEIKDPSISNKMKDCNTPFTPNS